LKGTTDELRKQNTACGHAGFIREVGVEPRGNVKALSKSAISERRKNDIQEEEKAYLSGY